MRIPSEDDVVDRLKAREPQAMEDLYDRYAVLVYSIARRIVADIGEAEDIVQETFLRAWNRAHLLDLSKGALAAWLSAMARNIAIDTLRAKRREAPYSFGFAVDLPGRRLPGAQFIHLNRVHVQRALQDLDSNQRLVIELAYFKGLSQSEMAQQMSQPLGTIKTWVRTALSSLRESI